MCQRYWLFESETGRTEAPAGAVPLREGRNKKWFCVPPREVPSEWSVRCGWAVGPTLSRSGGNEPTINFFVETALSKFSPELIRTVHVPATRGFPIIQFFCYCAYHFHTSSLLRKIRFGADTKKYYPILYELGVSR